MCLGKWQARGRNCKQYIFLHNANIASCTFFQSMITVCKLFQLGLLHVWKSLKMLFGNTCANWLFLAHHMWSAWRLILRSHISGTSFLKRIECDIFLQGRKIIDAVLSSSKMFWNLRKGYEVYLQIARIEVLKVSNRTITAVTLHLFLPCNCFKCNAVANCVFHKELLYIIQTFWAN